MQKRSRREFLKTSMAIAGSVMGANALSHPSFAGSSAEVQVCGHLWVYASRYPPHWDCTPILENVFTDFKYAGIEGLELMEVLIRHDDFVTRAKDLIGRYNLPVTGTSYSGNMWKRSEHTKILEDVELVLDRLHQVNGKTFGITVGDAGRKKTEDELDAQAELLRRIIKVCDKYRVQPNIHNHTFEVVNEMHDLKGIISRIPDIKLGPDLNWLVRGGVDPVWFIKNYGKQMDYMHIRDQDSQGKWTEAVGDGVMDFPAIAAELKKINYKGRAAIELAFQSPPVNEVRESWKKSRQYVKQVFGW